MTDLEKKINAIEILMKDENYTNEMILELINRSIASANSPLTQEQAQPYIDKLSPQEAEIIEQTEALE